MHTRWRNTRLLLGIVAVFLIVLSSALPNGGVNAAQIETRRLTLQAGPNDGGSAPGGTVHHFFEFTLATLGTDIGSIEFLYCEIASGTCDTPTGLDTTDALLGSEDGVTGWTLDASTNGAPFLHRTASAPATDEVAYQLQDIVNPSATNETFFVRISTYESEDTTGSPIDEGVVAASTATQIELTGIMPESLIFCTGSEIDTTNGIPDCTTATSGSVSFDQLFSPADTATALSQMAASTNANGGYSISVNGSTLTSGTNEVPPLSTATINTVGTGQFGMNLIENVTTTDINEDPLGLNVAPTSNGVDFKGQAATDYDVADTFKFLSGDIVADSGNGGAGPTNIQIFTIGYIVNVAGSQPAGTYNTTLTYICTANF